jgi:hypothetical protein
MFSITIGPYPSPMSRRTAIAYLSAVGMGVNGDGGNVQLTALRPLIQRLNIFQPMLKPIAAQIDLFFAIA